MHPEATVLPVSTILFSLLYAKDALESLLLPSHLYSLHKGIYFQPESMEKFPNNLTPAKAFGGLISNVVIFGWLENKSGGGMSTPEWLLQEAGAGVGWGSVPSGPHAGWGQPAVEGGVEEGGVGEGDYQLGLRRLHLPWLNLSL